MKDTLQKVEWGLQSIKEVLEETGFPELLDEHLDTVMRGLDSAGLPNDEAAILEHLGFPALAGALRGQVDLMGFEWRNGTANGIGVAREYQDKPASKAIDNAIAQVQGHYEERDEYFNAQQTPATAGPTETEPRKQRRWWNGLSQIVEGAALAVADVALASGMFKIAIPDEAQRGATVISVGAGVGKIMGGIGDLRGE